MNSVRPIKARRFARRRAFATEDGRELLGRDPLDLMEIDRRLDANIAALVSAGVQDAAKIITEDPSGSTLRACVIDLANYKPDCDLDLALRIVECCSKIRDFARQGFAGTFLQLNEAYRLGMLVMQQKVYADLNGEVAPARASKTASVISKEERAVARFNELRHNYPDWPIKKIEGWIEQELKVKPRTLQRWRKE